MSTIGPQFNVNPMGSAFQNAATKLASTQIATAKSDIKHQQENKKPPVMEDPDMVFLTNSDEGSFNAMTETNEAALTGVTAQKAKEQRKGDKTQESNLFGGEPETEAREDQPAKPGTGGQKSDEIGLKEKVGALSIMNKDPREITKDVPEHLLTVAKGIIEGQMQKGKPADSLKGIKETQETVPIDLKPLKRVEIMPIHDTNNHPIPVGIGSETNTD